MINILLQKLLSLTDLQNLFNEIKFDTDGKTTSSTEFHTWKNERKLKTFCFFLPSVAFTE